MSNFRWENCQEKCEGHDLNNFKPDYVATELYLDELTIIWHSDWMIQSGGRHNK